jgi:peptidoglycan hydrolase-like protein with peptidoglycan-binding domain
VRKMIRVVSVRTVSLAAAAVLAVTGLTVLLPGTAQAATSCNSFTNRSAWYDNLSGTKYAHIPSYGANTGNWNCVLGQGNQGIAVLVLQEALWSCYGQGIARDGDFGPNTREAVKNAQRRINQVHPNARLVVDGVFGPRTSSYMDFAVFDHANGGQIIYGHCNLRY